MDDKLLVLLKSMPPSSSPNVHQCQLQSLQRFLPCSHHQTCSCSTLWLTNGYRERGSDWLIEEKKCVSTSPCIWNPLTSLWVFHRVQAAWKLIHAYSPNPQLISSRTEARTVPDEVIDQYMALLLPVMVWYLHREKKPSSSSFVPHLKRKTRSQTYGPNPKSWAKLSKDKKLGHSLTCCSERSQKRAGVTKDIPVKVNKMLKSWS